MFRAWCLVVVGVSATACVSGPVAFLNRAPKERTESAVFIARLTQAAQHGNAAETFTPYHDTEAHKGLLAFAASLVGAPAKQRAEVGDVEPFTTLAVGLLSERTNGFLDDALVAEGLPGLAKRGREALFSDFGDAAMMSLDGVDDLKAGGALQALDAAKVTDCGLPRLVVTANVAALTRQRWDLAEQWGVFKKWVKRGGLLHVWAVPCGEQVVAVVQSEPSMAGALGVVGVSVVTRTRWEHAERRLERAPLR